jgi:anti-anti-sigma factor
MTVPFAVRKHEDGPTVRLVVVGEVDADVSAALTTIVANAVGRGGVQELVMDLRRVSFLAAAGLSALLEGHAVATERGCAYRLVHSGGIVERVLRVSGLLSVLGATLAPEERFSQVPAHIHPQPG